MYFQGGVTNEPGVVETESGASWSAFDSLTAPLVAEPAAMPDIDIKQEVEAEPEEMGSHEEMMSEIRRRSGASSSAGASSSDMLSAMPLTPKDEDEVEDEVDEQAVPNILPTSPYAVDDPYISELDL